MKYYYQLYTGDFENACQKATDRDITPIVILPGKVFMLPFKAEELGKFDAFLEDTDTKYLLVVNPEFQNIIRNIKKYEIIEKYEIKVNGIVTNIPKGCQFNNKWQKPNASMFRVCTDNEKLANSINEDGLSVKCLGLKDNYGKLMNIYNCGIIEARYDLVKADIFETIKSIINEYIKLSTYALS